ECSFFSDGIRLDGILQCQDGETPPSGFPAVIVCSGYQGLKEWIPPEMWSDFTRAGFACLAFDYRGFGTSDGERGRLIPMEQVTDVSGALTWLAQQPEIDPDRIGLIGWGLGGGVAVQTAADDRRVRA